MKTLHLRLSVLGLLCAAGFNANSQTPTDNIKSLLEAGQNQQAYEAAKSVVDMMGDAAFDFYFGIAALNAGQPGEGVLAIERYLMQFPDNRSARFQLARGYFMLGEDLRAKEEFEDLVADATPPEAVAIRQFLDAIRVRESRYRPTAFAYAEFGVLHDTNINSGLDSGPLGDLPGFAILPGSTQERESVGGMQWATGVNGNLPIQPGLALYGGLHVMGKAHQGQGNDQFDQLQAVVQAGITRIAGRHLFRAGLDHQQLRLDSQGYLGMTGLTSEWQVQADAFNRFGLGLNYAQLDYDNILTYSTKTKSDVPFPSGSDIRDSKLWSISGSWNRSFSHRLSPFVNAGLSLGAESNRKGRADLSRDFRSAKASVSIKPLHRLSTGLEASYTYNGYGAAYAPGLPKRKDDAFTLTLFTNYSLTRNWSLLGSLQHTTQKSNISLHDFDRNVVSVKARYELK